MRCERLIQKGLPKKEGKEPTMEQANQLIMHMRSHVDMCPYCNQPTFQVAVTPAKSGSNIKVIKNLNIKKNENPLN